MLYFILISRERQDGDATKSLGQEESYSQNADMGFKISATTKNDKKKTLAESQ